MRSDNNCHRMLVHIDDSVFFVMIMLYFVQHISYIITTDSGIAVDIDSQSLSKSHKSDCAIP